MIPPLLLGGARRGRDIGCEVGQASGEPRDILRDVDDVTTVRILPSLEAVDAHDGGDLGDEHLLNLRHSLQLFVGVRLQGPCRCRWRRFWGSSCRRCSVCTCVFAEEQGTEVCTCVFAHML